MMPAAVVLMATAGDDRDGRGGRGGRGGGYGSDDDIIMIKSNDNKNDPS